MLSWIWNQAGVHGAGSAGLFFGAGEAALTTLAKVGT
jgi:hypothetical protein